MTDELMSTGSAEDRRSELNALLCQCGCGGLAKWLISGYSPEGPYKNEPACDSAARYVGECAAEFNCSFSKVPIEA